MTTSRKFLDINEHNLWLRQQKLNDKRCEKCNAILPPYCIDDPTILKFDDGINKFYGTDIDMMWGVNFLTEKQKWMLIETKIHNCNFLSAWQHHMFKILNDNSICDKTYYGFHFVSFENTSPTNGLIRLDGKDISAEDYHKFLRFELEPKYYSKVVLSEII